MNSTFARDFLRSNRQSNIHLYPDDWKGLPVPVASMEQQEPISELVADILAVKERDPLAEIDELEMELDRLVYGLYGLTDEENGAVVARVGV